VNRRPFLIRDRRPSLFPGLSRYGAGEPYVAWTTRANDRLVPKLASDGWAQPRTIAGRPYQVQRGTGVVEMRL